MKRVVIVTLLAVFLVGCTSKGIALLTGGRIVEIECPVINPITGNIAVLPNGKAAVNRYKYITGGASQSFDVSAPGCVTVNTTESVQGENRLDSLTDPGGALLERAQRVLPGD